ncbi:hypothetical protein [Streptomyces sp. NBC_01089]|uniref:hypothetical protein n=1 Tax=Streptomyces sp. NBC_01089 TaxID=2903747 RepID=UPI003866BFCB|nr:hypothetical protein OG510_26505 [Streptomyces sp. NBC_01089]
MSLHRLTPLLMGVPHVERTAAYCTDFGLSLVTEESAPPATPALFSTVDGAPGSVCAVDPGTEVLVQVKTAARVTRSPAEVDPYDAPGVTAGLHKRALGILREGRVRSGKLEHVHSLERAPAAGRIAA